jgi:hypothetical protein
MERQTARFCLPVHKSGPASLREGGGSRAGRLRFRGVPGERREILFSSRKIPGGWLAGAGECRNGAGACRKRAGETQKTTGAAQKTPGGSLAGSGEPGKMPGEPSAGSGGSQGMRSAPLAGPGESQKMHSTPPAGSGETHGTRGDPREEQILPLSGRSTRGFLVSTAGVGPVEVSFRDGTGAVGMLRAQDSRRIFRLWHRGNSWCL